jgi:hypothetical protein
VELQRAPNSAQLRCFLQLTPDATNLLLLLRSQARVPLAQLGLILIDLNHAIFQHIFIYFIIIYMKKWEAYHFIPSMNVLIIHSYIDLYIFIIHIFKHKTKGIFPLGSPSSLYAYEMHRAQWPGACIIILTCAIMAR